MFKHFFTVYAFLTIFKVINVWSWSVTDPPDPYDECYNFLTEYMPERDKNVITSTLLNQTITYALLARNRFDYAQAVPWEIFLNNVLPYFVLNEGRENWRQYFFEQFATLADQFHSISNISVYMANNLWNLIGVNWRSDSTPLVMSPFECKAYGYASCTGHSITLTAALRSLGVPIRVAGTIWNLCNNTCCSTPIEPADLDDNHSWFEVFDNNTWSYCDADSCSGGLNNTWFAPGNTKCAIPGNVNYSIYASSYQTTPDNKYYILPWAYYDDSVNAYDVTQNYLSIQKKISL